MRRSIKLFTLLLLLGYLGGFFSLTCGQSLPNKSNGFALVGARIYPSATAPPIPGGVVLIKDGRIVAVGNKQQIKIPGDAKVIDCTGLTLVAGFWNSHVHFTESKWENAAGLTKEQLNEQLRDTFTRYGFTSVFDLGSSIEEYLLMMRAGMNFRQILASLTVNPAQRFGFSHRTGRITSGMDADIVIIGGDPETDIRVLSNVKYTLRKGHIVYQ